MNCTSVRQDCDHGINTGKIPRTRRLPRSFTLIENSGSEWGSQCGDGNKEAPSRRTASGRSPRPLEGGSQTGAGSARRPPLPCRVLCLRRGACRSPQGPGVCSEERRVCPGEPLAAGVSSTRSTVHRHAKPDTEERCSWDGADGRFRIHRRTQVRCGRLTRKVLVAVFRRTPKKSGRR